MASYTKLHAELEARRAAAQANRTRGPCVLVAGPADTGKTSLAYLLAGSAYAGNPGFGGFVIYSLV